MRLWLATPDWVFRFAGAAFFFGVLATEVDRYWNPNFWQMVPYCIFPNGLRLPMPWVPVLVDLTFLLIALSFCFRLPPRTRASNGWVISFTLLTGFLPLIPLWISPLLGLLNNDWQAAYVSFMWRSRYFWWQALTCGMLITVGNALEVWGYGVLWRSLSIVPEPRVLKTKGPYRWVRHPVYLGQFFAQAGVWLIAANWHIVWISLYVTFVAMQLYRSKLEDRVLEAAFGEPYREWRRRSYWFV